MSLIKFKKPKLKDVIRLTIVLLELLTAYVLGLNEAEAWWLLVVVAIGFVLMDLFHVRDI